MKKIIFAALFIFTAINAFAQEVPFTLEITNVRSDKGNIMVGICSTEDQFLEKAKCTYTLSVPASKGTIVQNLNIAKGKYAIIIYHDENNNKILDRAMFGKPQEMAPPGQKDSQQGADCEPPFFLAPQYDEPEDKQKYGYRSYVHRPGGKRLRPPVERQMPHRFVYVGLAGLHQKVPYFGILQTGITR